MYRKPLQIEVIGRKIILRLPKNETDIQFIRSFRFFSILKNNQNSEKC
ncbi:hypothetical protein P872_12955 [Rhodonellum psychrophilum GCM71 = DSM 17998]|uniref:Uncharacterized protein n=1 Tax=Rhodonellum psychrophilum GCM71 = DSM 17998 TaxID=1123057 RepID=U5BRS4_9BACT|nr:hypothetical protein P872_12955 [Rhodonellum psychrophilum GCM71 = DSM 17998]